MPGRLQVVVSDRVSASGAALILRLLGEGPGPVAVLDGGLCFDPFPLARAGRALLSRVRISRAFTCFQMEALASRLRVERFGGQAQPWPAPRAVVLSMAPLFEDDQVPEAEARRLMRRTVASLRRGAVVCVERPAAGPRARALLALLAGGRP